MRSRVYAFKSSHIQVLLFCTAAVLGLGVLPNGFGCRGVSKNFLNENDELRRQNMVLAQQVRDLEQTIEEKINQLDRFQIGAQVQSDERFGAALPRLNQVTFGRYSGAVDTDGDGDDDLIRAYVLTLDQNGRFMPIAGRAVLRADQISADQPPRAINDRTYGEQAFDEAYRSGIVGTHYTLELALPSPLPTGLDRARVAVFVYDAVTGVTHSGGQTIAITNSGQSP